MLRDYQQNVFENARNELAKTSGVCVVLPCRSGKSYIMLEICKNQNKNILILAHRNILLEQHKKLIDFKNVRIESVFTEVNHLGENGKVDLIIIDEAHISASDSFKKVCNYYNCKVIGFTATPCRLDGKPLNLFKKLIIGISANELIERKCIADYDLYAPKLDVDLSNVANLSIDSIAEIMLDKKIYGDIIENYKRLANNKKAIAYCVNVKHSMTICKLFNDNGISAVHIDSHTDKSERLKAISDFENGKYQIICNCNLISEGITLPNCDCCLLLRPTQSLTLYVQQSCRCLTPNGQKKVIIDFVGNCFLHGMPTDNFEWTLTEDIKPKNYNRCDDVLIRICSKCYRAYPTKIGRICPFCGNDNGKTKKEIEQDKQIELEKIKKIEKRKQGMARDYKSLVELGKSRGYKNPGFWAKKIIESRTKK